MQPLRSLLIRTVRHYKFPILPINGYWKQSFFSLSSVSNEEYNAAVKLKMLARRDETLSVKRARLVYQCRRRGFLELDLVLSSFIDKYIDSFDEAQLETFDQLVNRSSTDDWELYFWILNTNPVPSHLKSDVLTLLQDHAVTKRDSILRMPPLKESA